ncbi:single-stranded DNA-binding protein [Psychromicrobium sp. YIM B11713]|uniref:single-stranded DNA-binding protein n=1 Tax=Psychromicrobium sp. YIM B11713 TaxID=3145233 RepID=UPI00374F7F11
MNDLVTVRGFVASEIRSNLTESGWPVATFRLGSTERRFDRLKSQWVDSGTNWYTVSMFRGLAQNAACSVLKGERVIVTGKLKLRQWAKGERRGIAPEIMADAVGHDLVWGTARFKRASQNLDLSENRSSENNGSSSLQQASLATQSSDAVTESGEELEVRSKDKLAADGESPGWFINPAEGLQFSEVVTEQSDANPGIPEKDVEPVF